MMAFPAGLTLVTVNCRFDLPPGGGSTGTVRFTSPVPLVGPTDNSIVPPFTVTGTLAADGTCAVQLPATNDPQWAPVNWAYAVRVQAGAVDFRGTLQLDYLTAVVELADLIQVDGAATTGVTYATLAQLTAVDADVTAAEGAITALQGSVATLTTGVSAASAGYVKATDYGLAGWTWPMTEIQAGTVLATSGLSYVARIRVLSSTVSAINFHFTAGGSGLSNCFASLHTDAGVILAATAVSADQSATWNSGGYKTCPLAASQAVTPNGWYRVRWWFNGTGPTLSRGVNSSSAAVNGPLAAPNFFYSTADAGLTTAVLAPGTIGTQTGGATAFWVGVTP